MTIVHKNIVVRLAQLSDSVSFMCLPGDDPVQVAMKASEEARRTKKPVNFICDGHCREIGPEDIIFRKAPDVRHASSGNVIVRFAYSHSHAYPVLDEIRQALHSLDQSSLFAASDILFKAKQQIVSLAQPPRGPVIQPAPEDNKENVNKFIAQYKMRYPTTDLSDKEITELYQVV